MHLAGVVKSLVDVLREIYVDHERKTYPWWNDAFLLVITRRAKIRKDIFLSEVHHAIQRMQDFI